MRGPAALSLAIATGVLLLSSLGCRGPRGSEPRVSPESVVPAAASTPAREGAPGDEPDAVSPELSPAAVALRTPPPPQTRRPIALPFATEAIVVMPVRDSQPVVLFTDEKDPIRRRAAEFLRGRRHSIVPLAELRRVEEAAREGRLVLEDELQCRSGLTHDELIDRYFPTAMTAEIDATCLDGCTLQVSAHDRGAADDREFFAYASAPIRPPNDPRAWAAARLRPTNALSGGVHGGIISSHPPPIMFGFLAVIGPWENEPNSEFIASQTDVDHCAHPDPKPRFDWDLRLEIATDGHVARCEATSGDHRARPQGARCLCTGLEPLRFGKGRPGRRLRVVATDTGSFPTSAMHWKPRQPGTQVWADRLTEAFVLDTCLAEHRPEDAFSATVAMGLEPDGSISSVEVFGDITTNAQMQFSSCLVRQLPLVPLPCAPPGIDTLQVEIRPGVPED